jgi:hypothetical protein
MHAPLVSADLAAFSAARHTDPPRHLSTRYNEQGMFLREPGNTVVCHLAEGSETERAIADVRQRLLGMDEAADLAFTPLSSLHMTIFQGIIEYRRQWPYWPREMPQETAVDAMTEYFLGRFENFPQLPGFSMQITGIAPTGLTLKGATVEDDRIIARWRDAFASSFGYRHPNHDAYEFHITLSYVIRWFDEESLPRWQGLLDDCLEELRARVPVVALRPPAFCAFNDMNRFEELRVFETD